MVHSLILPTTAASRWVCMRCRTDDQGFDAAVADMEVGEIKEIHLMPEEAITTSGSERHSGA